MSIQVGELAIPITVTGVTAAVRDIERVDAEAAKVGAKKIDVAVSASGVTATTREILAVETRAVAASATVSRTLGGALAGLGASAKAGLGQVTSALGAIGGVGRSALGGLGIGLAAGGITAALIGLGPLVSAAVTASNAFEVSLRRLDSAARLTGVPLALLSGTSTKLQQSLGLSATTANTMVAEAIRLTSAAGRANETGVFLTRWLDLAASRGIPAARAMEALGETLRGQDDGLNLIGLRDPSAIYKSWGAGADQASRMSAIMNEVMQESVKVTGEFAKGMNTAQGAAERLTNAKQSFLVALGQAITGGTGYTGVLGALTGALNGLTASVTTNSGSIRGLVRDLASIIGAGAGLIGFFGGVGQALNVLVARLEYFAALFRRTAVAGAFGTDAVAEASKAKLDAVLAGRTGPFDDVGATSSSQATGRAPIVITASRTTPGRTGAGRASGRIDTGVGLSLGDQRELSAPGVGLTPDAITRQRAVLTAAADVLTKEMKAHPIKLTVSILPPNELTLARQRLAASFANIGNDLRNVLGTSVGAAFRTLGEGGGVMGAVKAFGASLLSGFGQILTSLGEQTLVASGLLAGIRHAFESLNPWAMAAAGVALIALGSFLSGMGGRAMGGSRGGGGGGGGSYSAPYGGDITSRTVLGPRAAPVNGQQAPTGRTGMPTTMQPIQQNFTIIGANDPKAQRDLSALAMAGARRGLKYG